MASFLNQSRFVLQGQNCSRLYHVSPLLHMDTNLYLHLAALPGSVTHKLCDVQNRNRSIDEVSEHVP